MPADPELVDHVIDLFTALGPISTGQMFSGTALYVRGDVMFAAILRDTVWMKSDDSTHQKFVDAGSVPFSVMRKTGLRLAPGLMRLPDAAMDDPDQAMIWARLSLPPAEAAALARRAAKLRKTSRAK
jgi:DNA transformation protein and related proteins